jgi:hypothetical protein
MAQLLLDAGKGFFTGARGVDQFDPFGFPLSEGAIPFGNFLIKAEVEIFEPILLSNGPGSAEGTGAGLGRIEIQNKGQIGFAVSNGKAVDEAYFFHGEATGIPLENGGGVVKAVGNDPLSSGHGRKNGLAYEFGPAGGKEKEFGFRLHRLASGIVLEQLANGFPEGGSSGFADFVNSEFCAAKPGKSGGDLCAFAAPFASLKGEEPT